MGTLLLLLRGAGSFISSNWRIFAIAALLAAVWLHGCSQGIQREKQHTLAARAETAEVRAEHERLVAESERLNAAAEAENRRIETGWRDYVSQREKDYAKELAPLRSALAAATADKRVLDAAVDAYAKAGFATADPAAACGDLRARTETLGSLVKERDRMAGECEAAIELVGSSLRLCRGYADSITAAPQ